MDELTKSRIIRISIAITWLIFLISLFVVNNTVYLRISAIIFTLIEMYHIMIKAVSE